MRGQRLGALFLVAAWTAVGSAPVAPTAWPGGKPFKNGTQVSFNGSVADEQGQPIPGVEVRLEASRRSFSYTRLRKLRYNPVVVAVETDSTGQFRIHWNWHNYYNHFLLSAVIPVRKPGGIVEPHVLASNRLEHELKGGSPILSNLTVTDTGFLEKLRAFEAQVDTADERRVYHEQGKPDRVDRLDLAGEIQESWWYFELGSMYRFSEGRLVEVETFDPVRGFAPSDP